MNGMRAHSKKLWILKNELELLERNVPRSRAQSSRIKDPAKAAGTAVPPVLSLRSI